MSGVLTPPLSPRNASYTIDARLDPATRTITGSETIAWRNITDAAGQPICSSICTGTPGRTRARPSCASARSAAAGDDRGAPRRRVGAHRRHRRSRSAARDRTAVEALHRARRRQRGRRDGDGGAAAAADRARRHARRSRSTWTAHVPRTFARTGAIGNFFFIAQWFPKLGVLQDDGWNCHQFHAGTEFFSDYGVYDVSLTVPARLAGRRHRRRSASAATTPTARRRIATTRKTSTTSRGRRAPTTSSGPRASSIRRCRRSRCGCCCSRSTRRRPSGTSTRRARR